MSIIQILVFNFIKDSLIYLQTHLVCNSQFQHFNKEEIIKIEIRIYWYMVLQFFIDSFNVQKNNLDMNKYFSKSLYTQKVFYFSYYILSPKLTLNMVHTVDQFHVFGSSSILLLFGSVLKIVRPNWRCIELI